MSEQNWEVVRVCYCEHVGQDVALEAKLVYPDDFLPDPPRVVSHRCSQAVSCSLRPQESCKWAGSNPDMDPFRH
jgi:hypothetical protein